MPADDPIDDQTPIFTQADVYMIGALVATRFDPSLVDRPTDPRIVDAIDEAVRWVLSR